MLYGGWGPQVRDIPKMRGWTQLSPHPRPLILGICLHPGALPYTHLNMAAETRALANLNPYRIYEIFLFTIAKRVGRRTNLLWCFYYSKIWQAFVHCCPKKKQRRKWTKQQPWSNSNKESDLALENSHPARSCLNSWLLDKSGTPPERQSCHMRTTTWALMSRYTWLCSSLDSLEIKWQIARLSSP
jgi:hypothetical protein